MEEPGTGCWSVFHKQGDGWSIFSEETSFIYLWPPQQTLLCVLWMSWSFDLCVLPLPCCSSVRCGNGPFKSSIAVPVQKGRKSIFRNRSAWPSLFFCLTLDFLQTRCLSLGTSVLKSLLYCNGSFTSWFIYLPVNSPLIKSCWAGLWLLRNKSLITSKTKSSLTWSFTLLVFYDYQGV